MRTLLRRSRIRSCTSSPEGVTPTRSGWTITIYAIGQVLAMPMAGKISDMYGRKKVLLVSVLVFNAASLACGFANDIYLLVGLRMVRALGGGAFMPSGMGLSVPASNNASLQLAPDQVASIAGLRGMFPPVRGIIAVSVTAAVLARSHDAGIAQAHSFMIFAVLLVLIVPLTFFVPEHKGGWRGQAMAS